MFDLNVKECSSELIHSEVIHKATGKRFDVTIVYGANDQYEREHLWTDLEFISRRIPTRRIHKADYGLF